MKNWYLLISLLLLGFSLGLRAQQKPLYLKEDAGVVAMEYLVGGTSSAVPEPYWKSLTIKGGLKFDITGLKPTTVVKIESKAADGTLKDVKGSAFRFAGNQYTFLGDPASKSIKVLKLTITPTGGTEKIYDDIGSAAVLPDTTTTNTTTDTATYASWRDYYLNNKGGLLSIIRGRQRYFPGRNVAYICLDPYGNIIGRKPINMDQDDEIIILMIVPDNPSFDNYSVNDNDAEYAPTDLNIRPNETINPNAIQSGESERIKYTVKVFEKGAYTSRNVTFSIMNGKRFLNDITVHINPLYHLGFGVSYVSSSLQNPDFEVVPLTGSTNTIKPKNLGRRTFLTVNAIWYWWPTFKYLAGSSVTRGRDVLKEPDFITRINPTFGIGLKGNLENNFFTGFNFEFARGGSISAGWHYGKVSTLLDETFQPGVTEFAGQKTDIITTDHWKWGGFFGVTLDTRIFNRLFTSSGTAE
jgi:hypothetical protein